MPMLCIAGTFRVTGTEPDGDSIRFVPTDRDDWSTVPGGSAVRVNAGGGAQLRADAIDALETHYTPRGGHPLHQPLGLAHEAAAELLEWLGFQDVVRAEEKVTGVQADDRPGSILTRTADKYGRCVALIGRGDPPAASGTFTHVSVALLQETANHHLLTTGLVYPTFYSLLYTDLRDELAQQAAAARGARAGVFAADGTNAGVTVASPATLTDEAVLLPKLFRRLADYLHLNADDPDLSGFAAFLEQKDDRVLIIPGARKTGLDNLVAIDGQTLQLTELPEDLVFDEG